MILTRDSVNVYMQLKLSSIPNLLTIMRLLLVIPLVLLLLTNEFGYALAVFVVAGLSDGLDGLLAKRFGWTSKFGSIADPIADKLLMVSSYFVLCWQTHLPWWLFVMILLRDLFIVGGAYTYHHLFGLQKITPTYISKFNTFMQILLVVAVIFRLASGSLSESMISILVYTTLFTTLVSGFQYTAFWGRKAYINAKNNNYRESSEDER